ncbi:MAG: class I SAM-dependent methyltransferase, partial [Deltaproteobacteria bacterium]|nr:class I SAM-dependent methyltransferase [Deltaproteobacteria bacterium]
MVDYRIWFDRYQRYKATVDLIQELAGSDSLETLDVDGHDDLLDTLLPGHRVKLWTEHVLSTSGGLPLEDRAVDVALALDVLEHVAPAERPFFINELARACKLACIFAFPIASASVV